MERLLLQYEKEYMKMAMLKHEETFRGQVSELHRLYRVQKMLMRDMKRDALRRQQTPDHQNGVLDRANEETKRIPSAANCSYYQFHERPRGGLDLEHPAEGNADDTDGENADATGAGDDESEVELTLATGSHRRRPKKEETSFTSDSGTSMSSSSTESGGETFKLQDWGLFNKTSPAVGMKEVSGGAAMRGDALEHPPWLFQCLSLNMT